MKALVLHAINDLRYEEVPDPVPQKEEVLIKIKASGICGSDIPRVTSKGTYHFPTIPGHEFAGEIVAAGEGTDKSLIGQKAAVFPLLPCFRCDSCQIGEYAGCSEYNYFGSRCDGGFAEYIAVPVWNLVLCPDHLSYEEAAMCEPAAVAVHALRRGDIEIGDVVAIFGAGPIGLMLDGWAKIWGASKVFLTDIDPCKVEFAKSLGFDAINSMETDAVQYILSKTNGRGADLCIEGAGSSVALEQCLYATRSFGRVVAMGNPSGDMKLSQKGYWELLRKQLTLQGTWNSSYVSLPKNDWQLAIEAMSMGKLDLKPLISHTFGLEAGSEPFQMMTERRAFFNKVMYKIWEE